MIVHVHVVMGRVGCGLKSDQGHDLGLGWLSNSPYNVSVPLACPLKLMSCHSTLGTEYLGYDPKPHAQPQLGGSNMNHYDLSIYLS